MPARGWPGCAANRFQPGDVVRVVLHDSNMAAFGERVSLKRAAAAFRETCTKQRHALI